MDGGSRCAFKKVAERDDGDDRDDVFYAYENIVTIVAHRRARQDKSLAECAESAFPKAALCSPKDAIASFDGHRLSKVLLRYFRRK